MKEEEAKESGTPIPTGPPKRRRRSRRPGSARPGPKPKPIDSVSEAKPEQRSDLARRGNSGPGPTIRPEMIEEFRSILYLVEALGYNIEIVKKR